MGHRPVSKAYVFINGVKQNVKLTKEPSGWRLNTMFIKGKRSGSCGELQKRSQWVGWVGGGCALGKGQWEVREPSCVCCFLTHHGTMLSETPSVSLHFQSLYWHLPGHRLCYKVGINCRMFGGDMQVQSPCSVHSSPGWLSWVPQTLASSVSLPPDALSSGLFFSCHS